MPTLPKKNGMSCEQSLYKGGRVLKRLCGAHRQRGATPHPMKTPKPPRHVAARKKGWLSLPLPSLANLTYARVITANHSLDRM